MSDCLSLFLVIGGHLVYLALYLTSHHFDWLKDFSSFLSNLQVLIEDLRFFTHHFDIAQHLFDEVGRLMAV